MITLLAACGTPAPPKLPATGTSVASLLATLDAAADRACACTDRDCTEEVARELDDALVPPEQPRAILIDAAYPEIYAATQRGMRCLWKHETVTYAYGKIDLETDTWVRDQVCACTDGACVRAVDDAIGHRFMETGEVPHSDEVTQADHPILTKRNECRDHAFESEGRALIESLSAVVERDCACTGADCKATAKADVEQWAKEHHDASASHEQIEEIRGLYDQLAGCLAGTEPAP
jgi:hypothetical protein